ncbi:hypothetical protein APHAL10511_002451 [Amanita phalloides]|nr:hypothetical protein APHAL10511_002451 [Amanita phalloides]
MASGIPPLPPGVFSITAFRLIDAPIDDVWRILLDFPAYSEWNPFVRGQAIVDKNKITVDDQTPRVGQYISMEPVHIPPTMGEPGWFGKSSTMVQISTLDHENHRAAWITVGFPNFLLRAERWQVLSVDTSGKTKYETAEVFSGILTWFIYFFVHANLKLGFSAHADGLKNRAERLHKTT